MSCSHSHWHYKIRFLSNSHYDGDDDEKELEQRKLRLKNLYRKIPIKSHSKIEEKNSSWKGENNNNKKSHLPFARWNAIHCGVKLSQFLSAVCTNYIPVFIWYNLMLYAACVCVCVRVVRFFLLPSTISEKFSVAPIFWNFHFDRFKNVGSPRIFEKSLISPPNHFFFHQKNNIWKIWGHLKIV